MRIPNPVKLACLLLLLPIVCIAQRYRTSFEDYYMQKSIDSRRAFQRMYIGFGKQFVTGKATFAYNGYDPVANEYYHDTSSKSVKTKRSWTFFVGTYIPVAIVTDKSMIDVSIELNASIFDISYDSLKVLGPRQYLSPVTSFRAGIPICVEYRSGGDITLNKNDKGMFLLGAGIMPCIVNSEDADIIVPYKAMPFIRAEAGFFAGLAFKVRATAFLGKSKYWHATSYDITHTYVKDQMLQTIEGSNGYNLSLIIMPFSGSWNRD